MGQNPTDSEVHDMINEVDVDGSGVVEFEEFVQFIARYWNLKFKFGSYLCEGEFVFSG